MWAEYYAIKDPLLKEQAPFFSHDIDFLKGNTTAKQLHDHWKGKLTIPSERSETPLYAKLQFSLDDGRNVTVDFLKEIDSPSNKAVIEKATPVPSRQAKRTLLVMHPEHCLTSRLYNTYGPLDRRSRQYSAQEIRRIKLALTIMSHYITDLFKDQDKRSHKEGYRLISNIANISIQKPALRAHLQDNIDTLECIPTHPDLKLNKRFLNENYPAIQILVNEKRKDYANRNKKEYDIEPCE